MATTRAVLTPFSAEFPPSNFPGLTTVNARPVLASTALAGSIMRLSTNNKAYWCDGTAWRALDIVVSASAPSNPQTNDLWVDIS